MQQSAEGVRNNGEKLLRVLFFTLILSVMNASMFNVVLPKISAEFDLVPSQVSWVITAYLVVYAVGTVIYGKLADHYSLRSLITFGLIFFTIGSIAGLLAHTYWMVVAGRVLQSAGAAVIPATAMLIPVRYFPMERRGRALGMVAVGLALGNAIAPIVGGLVSSMASWRLLFGLSGLVLLTLPYYRKYLGTEKRRSGHTDYIGGVLLGGTVATLLLGVTLGNGYVIALGAICFLLFLARIRLASEPFVQPKLFRNRAYTIGLVIAFTNTGVVMGLPFLTPQLLTSTNGLSPAEVGFIMLPAAVASALMGRKGGKLADARGASALAYIAIFLLFACFALLSVLAGMSPIYIMLILILGNLGQTFMQIALSKTISGTLAKDQMGVGMGLFSMNSFIAGAVSASVVGKILDYGEPTIRLNPFFGNHAGLAYSNIFVVFALLVIAVFLLFYFQFGTYGNKAVSVLGIGEEKGSIQPK
ncbi:MFS transporter [Cohnella silvisoli]|uniref:MFS transporter n=1 Tax=Cohnella silvisoli TaxID=2873699 RepID=A0ABV1KW76_9BACL|nr:MFS transporter [Cohnella silvisoli]MCD9023702.1 MFS transporter [Cohnella silvisoli]